MAQKISVQIVGDAKDLRRAFKDAEDSSKGFADKFRADTEILARFAKRGALAIAGIAAAVVGISLKGGIDRLMGLERANKQLGQLGVEADAADGLMDSLLDTLRGTPFALDKGAESLAGFVASGRDLEDVPRLIQQVTDAAAFGNTTLEDMDFIWQRIQTTGKATNEVLRMLAERNIPVYTQLAGALGVTADEVFEMATRGEISADIFFDAWEQAAEGTIDNTVRIAGAAQALGDTTEGAFGNMRTAMSRFGATLLEDVFPLAKDVFNAIGEGFDRMGEVFSQAFSGLDTSEMEEFIGRIPQLMEDAAESVVDFWQETETLRDVAGTALRGIAEILTNKVAVGAGVALVALRALYAHPVIAGLGLVAVMFGHIAQREDDAREAAENLLQAIRDVNTEAAITQLGDIFSDHDIALLQDLGISIVDLATGVVTFEEALEAVSSDQDGFVDKFVAGSVEAQVLEGKIQRLVDTGKAHEQALSDQRSEHIKTIEEQHRAEAAAIALGDATEGATEDTEGLTEAQEEAAAQSAQLAEDYDEAMQSLRGATDRSFSEMASDVEGFLDGFSELPEKTDVSMAEFEANFKARAEAMREFWDGLGELAERGLDDLVDELIREGPGAVDIVKQYVADPTAAELQNSYIEGTERGLLEAQALVLGWKIPDKTFRVRPVRDGSIGGHLPKFHQGGEFRAPTPGGEGLAILRDRETVSRPGQNGHGPTPTLVLSDGSQMSAETMVRALIEWQRRNGPLPFKTV